jgi:hypothetical protein
MGDAHAGSRIGLLAPGADTARFEINYNEAWNAYLQTAAAAGQPIYGQPPKNVYANYPPLSFHLIGMVGRTTGSVLMADRWISAAWFFAIALLIGLTVRRLTGAARCGVYAGLAFVIFVGIFQPDYIGMNLFGMAIGMAGLYCLVAAGANGLTLGLSAAARGEPVYQAKPRGSADCRGNLVAAHVAARPGAVAGNGGGGRGGAAGTRVRDGRPVFASTWRSSAPTRWRTRGL